MSRYGFGAFSASAPRNKRIGGDTPLVAPTFTAQPAILGTPVENTSVGFYAGEYNGTLPISAVSRFLINGAPVGADNDATYRALTADVTKTLSVRVTLTGPGGTAVATSAGVVVAAAAPAPAPAPAPPPPGSPGAATLTWLAPERDGDNTVIADLASFKVYWSRTFGGTDNSATVSASTLTYTTPLLSPGRWYFQIAAVDTAGNESNFLGNREEHFKDIA